MRRSIPTVGVMLWRVLGRCCFFATECRQSLRKLRALCLLWLLCLVLNLFFALFLLALQVAFGFSASVLSTFWFSLLVVLGNSYLLFFMYVFCVVCL